MSENAMFDPTIVVILDSLRLLALNILMERNECSRNRTGTSTLVTARGVTVILRLSLRGNALVPRLEYMPLFKCGCFAIKIVTLTNETMVVFVRDQIAPNY